MKKQDVASPLRQTINGATYSVPAILRMIDAAARDAYRGSDRAMIELVAQLIRDQQAEIESLRAAVTIVEENEQLRSRLAEAERVIREHNESCQDRCGRGEQEAVACKYRPYFLHSGRRCSECPVLAKLDYPAVSTLGAASITSGAQK